MKHSGLLFCFHSLPSAFCDGPSGSDSEVYTGKWSGSRLRESGTLFKTQLDAFLCVCSVRVFMWAFGAYLPSSCVCVCASAFSVLLGNSILSDFEELFKNFKSYLGCNASLTDFAPPFSCTDLALTFFCHSTSIQIFKLLTLREWPSLSDSWKFAILHAGPSETVAFLSKMFTQIDHICCQMR